MDPLMVARMVASQGRLPEAVNIVNAFLASMPPMPYEYYLGCVMERSDWLWELGNFKEAVWSVRDALAGRTIQDFDEATAQELALKWRKRATVLQERWQLEEARASCEVELFFWPRRRSYERASTHGTLAFLKLMMNDFSYIEDINLCKQHRRAAKDRAKHYRQVAIGLFRSDAFEMSVTVFDLCLRFHPEDGSYGPFRQSVFSDTASAYFALEQFGKALESGQQSYNAHPTSWPDEARRWKERGRILSVEQKRHDLLPECYTIALSFAGDRDTELAGQLYSNRALAFKRLGKWEEALEDARRSVQLLPRWSKAHYRLGSSLFALKRNPEAMDAFCKAASLTGDENERQETLTQIIEVSLKTPDGTTRATFRIPRQTVQKAVDDCIKKKKWRQLYALFLGGGGEKMFQQHVGGLASGCDASTVKLEQITEESNVPRLDKFISTLMEHQGPPVCDGHAARKQPVDVAKERKDVRVTERPSPKPGRAEETQTLEESLKDAAKLLRDGNATEAAKLLRAAKSSAGHGHAWQEVLKLLAEAEFKLEHYKECLAVGRELQSKTEQKSEAFANQWKDWGNELWKKDNVQFTAEYYSLAIKFLPGTSAQLRAKLLSNRSMAYLRREAFPKAQKDARDCITLWPEWFRGYYRLGDCFQGLKNHQEALKEFCRSYEHAKNDKERRLVAHEIVSTAMASPDCASKIPFEIPSKILNMVIEDIVEKQEWDLLRFLFLESRQKRGTVLGSKCDAACVPLDKFLESDFRDKEEFLMTLIKHGALCDGIPARSNPPLVVALKKEDYACAVVLLQKGADVSCVLGPNTFVGSGQVSCTQWLKFGRREVASKHYDKAVMCLGLSLTLADNTTEKTVRYEANSLLSESRFQLNEFKKCLQAGEKCFKLRPTKSEAEAKAWISRGKMLLGKRIPVSTKYFDMAAKYVPANDKKLLVEVLCNRSDARQGSFDFGGALEDAKNVTKFAPELLKGYRNLLQCYKKLGRHAEAIQAINECLERSPLDDRYNLLKDALFISSDSSGPGNMAAITADIPSPIVKRLVREVVENRDWKKLGILYLGGGGRGSHPSGGGGLASGFDASEVPIELVISSQETNRLDLVSALLKDGAHPDGLGNANVVPLTEAIQQAIQQNNLTLVEELVKRKANPCALGPNGETPLHEAMRLANRDGNFRVLDVLLKSNHERIYDVQDSKGNSLYHFAAFGKRCTTNKCKAIKMLRDANINPGLSNKEGKRSIDFVTVKDSRWALLKNAMDHYDPKKISRPTEVTEVSSNAEHVEEAVEETADEPSGSRTEQEEEELVSKSKASTPVTCQKKEWKSDTRSAIADLIRDLVVEEIFKFEESESDEEAALDETESVPQPAEEGDVGGDEDVVHEDAAAAILESEDTGLVEENDFTSPFENLPWEVDCTDDVWRILQTKKVDVNTKRRIVSKIRMLADGRWSKTMCKRLEGAAKQHGILLFEAKLSKAARILWEKTIAFSPRCSKDPQLRVQTEQGKGSIYSEIIRVWDVVLDHDSLERKIEKIVRSHDRGLTCIVKKDLKGIKRGEGKSGSECHPNYYMAETGEKERKRTESVGKRRQHPPAGQEESGRIFFPPASPNDQEYHILKFYSFNTPLVKAILEGDNAKKVDFPFKVTELEDAIIRLQQDPPRPVILIGRSGTGKTTCCLYRLWSEFQIYWDRAVTAGPHIPKYVPPEPEEEQSSEGNAPEAQENESFPEKSPERSNGVDDAAGAAENGGASDPARYEHLHQLFITKNSVLCSEVQKNFQELLQACPSALDHQRMEDDALPDRIQDVDECAWPLFINSRTWLLMLDASLPGEPFFKRNPDGSLKRRVEGWGEEDHHLQYIPDEDFDDDEEDGNEDGETRNPRHGDEANRTRQTAEKEVDPRREITYEVFKEYIWPKMAKKCNIECHPTLVWTEIRSFIKGSARALQKENGRLSLEEYHDLGKKMAPNFTPDLREEVYKLFEVYERVRSNARMFDEADLILNLHRRLQITSEWSIHRLYVDETQDFSQSELSLLIRCCRQPNDIFFTGDTAQSIMRGIAFRFSDLKSLFYHANEEAEGRCHQAGINVPDRLFQLTHNYRSHAGILRLASGVVDLLLKFFPESFDKLEKDQGLFDGPKPVILESCSVTDLAMIMRGNRRLTSRIEFGAHQAILVRSNEAREALPEELRHGLVMTIYEAKGLEFDDVLIYNFFKDSQAGKEWRVVTSVANERENKPTGNTTSLVELSEEALRGKSRPLDFDPQKHKVLNSEFKYLYTAITRARVNVWFFDEDETNRSPMFEYFQMLGLVEVVSREVGEDGQESLTRMFAEKSTPVEWRERGLFFYKKRIWDAAVQCFTLAGDDEMIDKSRAHEKAAEARSWFSKDRSRMREEFLKAAEQFLKCKLVEEAEICLHNAKEWLLLAQLQSELGKFAEAAKNFRKAKHFEEASNCHENLNNYEQAVEVLYRANLYQEAINVLERYHVLPKQGPGPVDVKPPNPLQTVERLCFKLAGEHYQNGEFGKMEEVLQRLPSAADRIGFLKNRGCVDAAVRAMVEDGRNRDAAQLLRAHGKFLEAIKHCTEPLFVADCMMAAARTSKDAASIRDLLSKAEDLYRRCRHKVGRAKALLLFGQSQGSMDTLEQAAKLFKDTQDYYGTCKCVEAMFKATRNDPLPLKPWMIVRAIGKMVVLITTLCKSKAKLDLADEKLLSVCEEHYGLFKSDDVNTRVCYTRSGSLFSEIAPDLVPLNTSVTEIKVDVVQLRRRICAHATDCVASLIHRTHELLDAKVLNNSPCSARSGSVTKCESAECKYPHADTPALRQERFTALFNLVKLNVTFGQLLAAARQHKLMKDFPHSLKLALSRSSERLYQLLFSTAAPERLTMLQEIWKRNDVRQKLRNHAEWLWTRSGKGRLSDIDCFLEVCRILELADYHPLDVVTRWVHDEETALEQDLKKKKPPEADRTRRKMGLIGEKGGHQSFFHSWIMGRRLLLEYGRVHDAAHNVIRRFLSLPAKRTAMRRFPSIANTVMILEEQLTACLASYASLFPGAVMVCLPKSYLEAVKFWDSVRCTSPKHYMLYDAVEVQSSNQHPAKLQRDAQNLLACMVDLMCGRISPSFDVVADAFEHEDSTPEDAERTLVLALTMLCNCGRAIPIDCRGVLLESLWKIVPSGPRANSALEAAQNAPGIRGVLSALEEILASRDDKFYDLRWRNHQLWFNTQVSLDPSQYPPVFPADLLARRAEIRASERTKRVVPEMAEDDAGTDDVAEEEEEEPATDLPQELEEQKRKDREDAKRRNMAATRIQRCFRRRKEYIRQESGVLSRNVSMDLVEEHFSRFKIDVAACGVCGEEFLKPVEDDDLDENTGDGDEKSSQSEMARWSHEYNSAHQRKCAEFNEFKTLYRERVAPALRGEEALHKASGQGGTAAKDLDLDLQRLREAGQKLKKAVSDLESRRAWNEGEGLTKAIAELETAVRKVEKLMHDVSSRNVENDDGDLIHEEEEEEADQRDVHVLQPRGAKGKGGGGKRKNKRKRNDKKKKAPAS